MAEHFPWDNAEEKTGLKTAKSMIVEKVSEALNGIVMHSSIEADNKLMVFMQAEDNAN